MRGKMTYPVYNYFYENKRFPTSYFLLKKVLYDYLTGFSNYSLLQFSVWYFNRSLTWKYSDVNNITF